MERRNKRLLIAHNSDPASSNALNRILYRPSKSSPWSLFGFEAPHPLCLNRYLSRRQSFGNLLPEAIPCPSPVLQERGVHAGREGLIAGVDLGVQKRLSGRGATVLELRHPVDGIHSQTESIRVVADRQLNGGVDVALLLVATDMQVPASGTLVCQSVHHPGIAVEVEDDGSVSREEAGPFSISETVRVVAGMDQLEEIHTVDTTDLEIGEVLQEKVNGGDGLMGADITTRGHDEIGVLAGVGAELRPDTNTLGAVLDGGIHSEELQVVLLV